MAAKAPCCGCSCGGSSVGVWGLNKSANQIDSQCSLLLRLHIHLLHTHVHMSSGLWSILYLYTQSHLVFGVGSTHGHFFLLLMFFLFFGIWSSRLSNVVSVVHFWSLQSSSLRSLGAMQDLLTERVAPHVVRVLKYYLPPQDSMCLFMLSISVSSLEYKDLINGEVLWCFSIWQPLHLCRRPLKLPDQGPSNLIPLFFCTLVPEVCLVWSSHK